MEKDIEKLKREIESFIIKYKLKTFEVNTDIYYFSRINDDNSQKWITEYHSKIQKIDINLTK